MSERRINLEEILKRFSHVDHGAVEDFWFTENVIKAMKEACRQTLELAAENADVKAISEMISISNGADFNIQKMVVNKQSILNTIKQIE